MSGQAFGRRDVGRIGVTLGVLIASSIGVAGCTVDGPPGQGPQGARPPAAAGPPASVEIPRERTRVYVANESSSTVTVIDALTFEVVGTIDAKNHATHDLALSRDGRRLFATNLASGRLSVIDTAAMEVVGSVYTGARSHVVALTNDDRQAWVANVGEDNVSIVEVSTLRILRKHRDGQGADRSRLLPRWTLCLREQSGRQDRGGRGHRGPDRRETHSCRDEPSLPGARAGRTRSGDATRGRTTST